METTAPIINNNSTSVSLPATPQLKLPSPKKKPWLLLIFFGLLLITSITFGIYLLGKQKTNTSVVKKPTPTSTVKPTVIPSPIPDPSTTWQTCTNKEFGFSTKYPNAFSTGECQVFMLSKKDTPSEQAIDIKGIKILVQKNPQKMSFLDWLKSPATKQAGEIVEPTKDLKIKEKLISGTKWLSFEENEIPLEVTPSGKIYWAVLHEDKVFLIGLINLNLKEYKSTIELMLSTLKFIN